MTTISNPPIWQQNRAYSARLDRTVVDLIFTEGVVDPGGGDFEVTETSPQSLSVAVNIGRAVVAGDDETRQGKYLVVNDAVLNVPLAAADPADDRIDLIVLQVNDPVAGSARTPINVAEVVAITGTPAGSPSPPALPDTAIPLAEVTVTASATFVTNADISDSRSAASNETFTVDSNFEILTAAEIALLTPYAGQTVYNSTTNVLQFWDGSSWQTIGSMALDDLSDVSAGSPVDGQAILYDSGTGDWQNKTIEEQASTIIGFSVFA